MNLYINGYDPRVKELYNLEMNKIFRINTMDKIFTNDKDFNINKSVFTKEKIKIIYIVDSIEELIGKLAKDNTDYKKFKLNYIKIDKVEHESKIKTIQILANAIRGIGEFNNPDNQLAITKYKNKWIFGHYQKNDFNWRKFKNKPYSSSHSLDVDLAQSLINLAIDNDNDKLIDPCAGLGTVLLCAKEQDYNITGIEINKHDFYKLNKNIDYYDFDIPLIKGDMLLHTEQYNCAILDIPYGIMCQADYSLQKKLINHCSNIANKLVLVANEPLIEMVEEKFVIDRQVEIKKTNKGKFKRYITILNKK